MTLDSGHTPAELRRIATERQIARFGRVIDPGLKDIDQWPTVKLITDPAAGVRVESLPRDHVVPLGAAVPADCPVRVKRWDGGCHLAINLPPRTKKNHGRAFGIRQSDAYVHYRDTIVNSVALWTERAQLPLEDREYNIRATYYVDTPGQQADLVGLHQGLFDALENAGVVSDDWWFRRADGSRVIAGDPNPRVEVLISAIEP